jgi:hypothetical protein
MLGLIEPVSASPNFDAYAPKIGKYDRNAGRVASEGRTGMAGGHPSGRLCGGPDRAELLGPANGSKPIRSETNRTSS